MENVRKMAETEATRQTTLSVDQLKYLRREERKKLSQLMKRRRMTQRLLMENEGVLATVNELDEEKETETIFPLGAGILVKGKIIPKTLKRTLPGNVVLPSSREDVQADLANRRKILIEDAKILDKEIQKTGAAVDQMEQILGAVRQKIMETRRKK